MQHFDIPAGAKMYIGAPENPMPKEIAEGLARLVSTVPGVMEAHLPQVFIEGATQSPTQMLVLAIEPGVDAKQVAQDVNNKLPSVLPPAASLNILPFEEGSFVLVTVRSYNCLIYKAPTYSQGRTPAPLRV